MQQQQRDLGNFNYIDRPQLSISWLVSSKSEVNRFYKPTLQLTLSRCRLPAFLLCNNSCFLVPFSRLRDFFSYQIFQSNKKILIRRFNLRLKIRTLANILHFYTSRLKTKTFLFFAIVFSIHGNPFICSSHLFPEKIVSRSGIKVSQIVMKNQFELLLRTFFEVLACH